MEKRRDDCGATNVGLPGMRAAGAATFLVALCLVVFTGCMGYTITKETEPGVTSTSVADGSAAGPREGEGSEGGGSSGGSATTSPTTASDFDRAEIERRLALPPFAYVAEADVKPGASGSVSSAVYTAAFAVVDSLVDTLAARPECASHPIDVAVAPDGELVYVTDWGEPVIHVLNAETKTHLRDIELPGLRAPDLAKMQAYVMDPNAPVPWDWVDGCSGAIAATPDGALLLVATHSGLMVVDTSSETVVRTLADIQASAIAVSFDGRRAYLGTYDWATRDPRSALEWIQLRNQGVGGSLTALDLQTWMVLHVREIGFVNGIAMKPDDSEVYVSDHAQKALRMVDALTLEDRGLVPLGRSFPVGVGVLPDGSKAYVVCSADTTDVYAAATQRGQVNLPSAEDYFCAVVDVGTEEVVKRIPLETY